MIDITIRQCLLTLYSFEKLAQLDDVPELGLGQTGLPLTLSQFDIVCI